MLVYLFPETPNGLSVYHGNIINFFSWKQQNGEGSVLEAIIGIPQEHFQATGSTDGCVLNPKDKTQILTTNRLNL